MVLPARVEFALALAQRWGYPFAMLPAFCALAPVVLADPIQVSPSSMFLIWVLRNLVAGFAQRKIDDWVLARLLPASRNENARGLRAHGRWVGA